MLDQASASSAPKLLHPLVCRSMRVSLSDNAITNAIDIFRPLHGQVGALAASCWKWRQRHWLGPYRCAMSCACFRPRCIAHSTPRQVRLMCSNNDDAVRVFDAETFQLVRFVGCRVASGALHGIAYAAWRLEVLRVARRQTNWLC